LIGRVYFGRGGGLRSGLVDFFPWGGVNTNPSVSPSGHKRVGAIPSGQERVGGSFGDLPPELEEVSTPFFAIPIMNYISEGFNSQSWFSTRLEE